MPQHKFIEDGEISGTRITSDGYLVGEVRCARTGIQDYAGFELDMPEVERVRVYRPEDEVFSKKSLSTFVGKPATDNHPSEPVTAGNWKQLAVGSIGSDVLRDGEYIRVPLTLMDAGIIEKVNAGKREISMGYEMTLDFTAGQTPDGEDYDAVMRDLKMNHLAIVDKGRAGSAVRIGDKWGASPITNDGKITMTLKTIVVDGLSVETTDAGAKAIEKLQADNRTLKDGVAADKAAHDKALTDKQAANDAAIAEKDTQLAAKDSEIADLKGQVLDSEALDARVEERATLIAKASQLAKDADFTGKSDLQIKTMAVDAVRGADFAKDKSPAYIEAAFDLAEVKTDTVREVLKDRKPDTAEDNGQAGYEKRLSDAWKEAK